MCPSFSNAIQVEQQQIPTAQVYQLWKAIMQQQQQQQQTENKLSWDSVESDRPIPVSIMASFFLGNIGQSHRKLERTRSETITVKPSPPISVNTSRYKTELCRPYEESGTCKYISSSSINSSVRQRRRNWSGIHEKYIVEIANSGQVQHNGESDEDEYEIPLAFLISNYIENEGSIESDTQDNADSSLFDRTIGCIEDILVDDNFLELQNKILDKYWKEFDDTEENKFCYTTIFEEYVTKIEQYIENKLKEENPQFDMSELFHQLQEKKSELEGEVFDMLYTLSDFMAFKDMVLNYKNFKEGKLPDVTEFMTVTPVLLDYHL